MMFRLNREEIANGYANAERSPYVPDTSPGFFEGSLTAVPKGFEQGGAEAALLFLDKENEPAAMNYLASLKPDPRTTGYLANLLQGVASVIPPAIIGSAATLGNPIGGALLVGETKGYTARKELETHGVDETTATNAGIIEGVAQGAGVLVPTAVEGNLITRAGSGAAINVGVGAAQRGATGAILDAHGYKEMADQYRILDGLAMVTDATIGGMFGALHTEGARPEPLPSQVDAALAANNIHQLEIESAPGIPADIATRNAHVAAMDTATEQVLRGEPVDVADKMTAANFVPKPENVEAGNEFNKGLLEDNYNPADLSSAEEATGVLSIRPKEHSEGFHALPSHSTDSIPEGVFATAKIRPSIERGSNDGNNSVIKSPVPKEYHKETDAGKLFTLARASEPDLAKQLKYIAESVEGAEFGKVRVKDETTMKAKTDLMKREANQVGDYLGGRIIVKTERAFNEVIERLKESSDVLHIDDFRENPKDAGYRGVHAQIMGKNGLSAEVQILAEPIARAKTAANGIYAKWRRRKIAGEDIGAYEADIARHNKLFDDAHKEWLASNKDEELQIMGENGEVILAKDALAKVEEEIVQAEKDRGLFEAAVNCFIRNGDAG